MTKRFYEDGNERLTFPFANLASDLDQAVSILGSARRIPAEADRSQREDVVRPRVTRLTTPPPHGNSGTTGRAEGASSPTCESIGPTGSAAALVFFLRWALDLTVSSFFSSSPSALSFFSKLSPARCRLQQCKSPAALRNHQGFGQVLLEKFQSTGLKTEAAPRSEGLSEYNESIEKIRLAVKFVKGSSQRLERFKKCVANAEIECRALLCLDVDTRWNSTYLMLETAIKFERAFKGLEDATSYSSYFPNGPPTPLDWKNASLFVKLLKLFYSVTLEEDTLKMQLNFDILNWWKVNSTRFPILSEIARDVLAIPISTVASESAFSTGGRILDPFRSSLAPKTVEALVCCRDWLRCKTSLNEIEEMMIDTEKYEELDKELEKEIRESSDNLEEVDVVL
ncbi:hypothetical protein KSP39_PZI019378 [Platanthera zijinensis]|uniref:HAT C-terminal dimerisation domain-containing protein n=1 Tax=Platanthera zijinensis TaxID=2320716 RepID=A0AAP0FYC1_9ASPA